EEYFGLVRVDLRVARRQLHAADEPPMIFADADPAVGDDALVARERLRRCRRAGERTQASGGHRRQKLVHPEGLKKGYHVRSSSRRTSPSRKIDPATTMRGARRHAAARASRGDASTMTGTSGRI